MSPPLSGHTRASLLSRVMDNGTETHVDGPPPSRRQPLLSRKLHMSRYMPGLFSTFSLCSTTGQSAECCLYPPPPSDDIKFRLNIAVIFFSHFSLIFLYLRFVHQGNASTAYIRNASSSFPLFFRQIAPSVSFSFMRYYARVCLSLVVGGMPVSLLVFWTSSRIGFLFFSLTKTVEWRPKELPFFRPSFLPPEQDATFISLSVGSSRLCPEGFARLLEFFFAARTRPSL